MLIMSSSLGGTSKENAAPTIVVTQVFQFFAWAAEFMLTSTLYGCIYLL